MSRLKLKHDLLDECECVGVALGIESVEDKASGKPNAQTPEQSDGLANDDVFSNNVARHVWVSLLTVQYQHGTARRNLKQQTN